MRFMVGYNYYGRSVCDADCTFSVKVMKRTDKTVTISADGKIKRVKIHVDTLTKDEYIYPFGKYSMAPIVRASKAVV